MLRKKKSDEVPFSEQGTFLVFTRKKKTKQKKPLSQRLALEQPYGTAEAGKAVLPVGGGIRHSASSVELSANFALLLAHWALCLYPFEVHTQLKRRRSSQAPV